MSFSYFLLPALSWVLFPILCTFLVLIFYSQHLPWSYFLLPALILVLFSTPSTYPGLIFYSQHWVLYLTFSTFLFFISYSQHFPGSYLLLSALSRVLFYSSQHFPKPSLRSFSPSPLPLFCSSLVLCSPSLSFWLANINRIYGFTFRASLRRWGFPLLFSPFIWNFDN